MDFLGYVLGTVIIGHILLKGLAAIGDVLDERPQSQFFDFIE